VLNASLVIILLDPLPNISSSDPDDEHPILPFQRAYSRGPFGQNLGMVGIFGDGTQIHQKLAKLAPYLKDTKSTKADLMHWVDQVEDFSSKDTELDPMIGLLWVIHRDITGFLTLVSNVLVEIGLSSADDYLMQSRLSHWRSLIMRFQIELPEIRASLDAFVRFVCEYQSLEIAAPFIQDTFTEINILIEQNEKSYAALRDDMALLESKRAIAQAESVNRITELGFIFIPISCVAGIFSMQIENFSTPPTLNAFVVGAVLAVIFAYLLRILLHGFRIARLKRDHYKKIEEREDLLPDKLASDRLGVGGSWLEWIFNPRIALNRSQLSYIKTAGIILISSAVLTVPITLVWTHKHLDAGFKSALTVLMFGFNALMLIGISIINGNRLLDIGSSNGSSLKFAAYL
jgi:hypothetical protein